MVTGTTTIDEVLAVCAADALGALELDALVDLVGALVRLWPRLDAARLRAIAAMDARAGYRSDGARDMVTWLADRAGERRGWGPPDRGPAAAGGVRAGGAAAVGSGGL